MKKLSTVIIILIGVLAVLAFLSAQLSRAQFDTLAPEQGGTGTGTAPTTNQILLGNASGTYDVTSTVPLGTPPGSDTQVIFNDGGAFGADADLKFNTTTGIFSAATSTFYGDITIDTGTTTSTLIMGEVGVSACQKFREIGDTNFSYVTFNGGVMTVDDTNSCE